MGLRSRLLASFIPALLAGIAATTALDAQARTCDLVRQSDIRRIAAGDGTEIVFLRGPVSFRCTDGSTLQADSAVRFEALGETRLMGNVDFRDAAQRLRADWLNTYQGGGRMLARGGVIYEDLESGSEVRGSELLHERGRGPEGQDRVTIRGPRPVATIYRDGEAPGTAAPASPRDPSRTAGGEERAEPMVVESDSMVMMGRSYFRAMGEARFAQGEVRGWADDIVFDDEEDRFTLEGAARVRDAGSELTAVRIEGELEDDGFRSLTAIRDARLTSDDLTVEAPELRGFFEEGVLQRLVGRSAGAAAGEVPPRARGERPGELRPGVRGGELTRTPLQPEEEAGRVRAWARDLRLVSDSLDVLAPGEILEQVIAVGGAYGERSLQQPVADLPEILAREWIRGDTITGWFVTRNVPAADSTVTELERLASVGQTTPARTLHRTSADRDDPGSAAANYMIARRITLHMVGGEVVDVVAEGPIRGVYLSREGGASPAPQTPTPPPVPEEETEQPR